MDIPEIEKHINELSASMVSLREELKLLKDSPKPDQDEIKSVRADLAAMKKSYDELMTKLQGAKSGDPTSDSGFGFFRFGEKKEPKQTVATNE